MKIENMLSKKFFVGKFSRSCGFFIYYYAQLVSYVGRFLPELATVEFQNGAGGKNGLYRWNALYANTKYKNFSELLPIKLRKIAQTKTDLDASFLSCSVCEDQAYCKHYGVITCEGFSFIT